MTDPSDRDLRMAWQSAPGDFTAMPLDSVHREAARFSRTIARRNLREYVAIVIVVAAFALYATIAPNPLILTGSLLTIAGSLFVGWQLFRRTSRDDPDFALRDVVAYYRARLEREAAALDSVVWWYLAPLVPGFVLFSWGESLQTPALDLGFWAFNAAVPLAILGTVWLLNHKAAKRLRQQASELDTKGDDQ